MPATDPLLSPVTLFPTVEDWLADMNARFAANRYGQIDDADLRAVFSGLAQVFADWRHLSVKRVKGAPYPVPYTDSLGLVAPEYRILGMQAVALNGTDSATGATGVVAPPVYYTLLAYNAGDVDALLDVEPGTTLTRKAHWVLASGTDEQKIASFPVLPLEDVNVYKGEVYQYTFPGGETRLLEIIDDITSFSHPVPTGLDTDPNYRSFAPLTASSGYDDKELRAELADHEDRLHTLEGDMVDLENEVAALTTDDIPEGPTGLAKYFTPLRAIVSPLIGYAKATAARAITAADSIRTAIGLLEKKADDNAAAIGNTTGSDLSKGAWNPVTNTPPLSPLAGTKGQYYKLSADSPAPVTTTIRSSFYDTLLDVQSTAGIVVGMLASGAGVPAGTRVVQVNGASSVELSQLTNLPSGTAITFTFDFAGQSSIAAGKFVWFSGTAWEVRDFVGGSASGPWPPFTDPVTDDVNKLFKATLPTNFRTTPAEYTTDGGTTTTVATEAMRSGNVLSAPVAGSKAPGTVGWR
ncbi:hypothetical protein, partial [Hymenobacter agri]